MLTFFAVGQDSISVTLSTLMAAYITVLLLITIDIALSSLVTHFTTARQSPATAAAPAFLDMTITSRDSQSHAKERAKPWSVIAVMLLPSLAVLNLFKTQHMCLVAIFTIPEGRNTPMPATARTAPPCASTHDTNDGSKRRHRKAS